MTLSIAALKIMPFRMWTLGIKTLIIVTPRIKALGITRHIIKTLTITTSSARGKL
jgi:hypothetical protein